MGTAGSPAKATSIAILAMGGEGGGVIADWLIDMAEHAGHYVQATSVPGVAQRTGATIYYVEIFPGSAIPPGKAPVLALMPMPGDVDLVVASELMEAGRAVQRGLVTPSRTTLVASTHRVYSMTERTAMADGRVDSAKLLDGARAASKRLLSADFAHIAEESGSLISAALFGAIAASACLPFARTDFEDAIRRSGLGVDASLAAFSRAYVSALDAPAATSPSLVPSDDGDGGVFALFPSATRAILKAGHARLADYQDAAYARTYLERLLEFLALDASHGDGSNRLLAEVARHLALWMSFEDVARVADLKIRRSRFDRVANEVRVQSGQILRIREFLHPRLEEIAGALPRSLGGWLLNSSWARSLLNLATAKGRIVETTSIGGFLLLYLASSLRCIRRSSLRFAEEHRRIDAWLDEIRRVTPKNYGLAVAIAECQQLVKGYGDTHARGLRNFEAIMSALPRLGEGGDAARRLSKLREAALADDTGRRLESEIAALPS